MLQVKIVFQGGGAKLVTLMAAASAIKELEEDKEFTITKIVGTSAGAIVACMLASGLPLETYRERVRTAGNELIKHFSTRLPQFPLMIKLWAGGTVLNENMLRLFFSKVFNEQNEGKQEIALECGSFRIPTIVIASDIGGLKKLSYDSSKDIDKKKQVVDILCDSCALPFVFRSFKHANFIVDGGVCSNLAAEELLRDDDEANVLGFSFQDDAAKTPSNLKTYAMALLWSAMSSGVHNNAERIRLAEGEVCELPNDYDTLQFDKALKDGLTEEAFRSIKDRIKPTLENTLKRFYQQRAIRKSAIRLPGQVLEAHKKLREVYPYAVKKSSTVIVANSLLPKSHPNFSNHDSVCQIIEYQPKGDYILALRVGVSKGKAIPLANERACRVEDMSGNDIPSTWFLVPADGPKGPYLALIYLNQPYPAASGPIKVILHTQQEKLLIDLKQTGRDYVRSKAGTNNITATEDFVVISDLLLTVTDLRHDVSLLPANQLPNNLEDMNTRWTQGHVMTKAEYQEYMRLVQVPDNCKVYGWRAENIQADHYCGALLQVTAPENGI